MKKIVHMISIVNT